MQRGQLLWQKQDSRCVLNKSMNILANDRKGDNGTLERSRKTLTSMRTCSLNLNS